MEIFKKGIDNFERTIFKRMGKRYIKELNRFEFHIKRIWENMKYLASAELLHYLSGDALKVKVLEKAYLTARPITSKEDKTMVAVSLQVPDISFVNLPFLRLDLLKNQGYRILEFDRFKRILRDIKSASHQLTFEYPLQRAHSSTVGDC
jgi:hypothetical protein